MNITGAPDWNPVLSAGTTLRVDYICPGCTSAQAINLQPPPWPAPVGRWTETDRLLGRIDHRNLDQITTQLWCHRCGIGADITVSG